MESKDFAVFILSHGRADTISTYKALRDGGYTGRKCNHLDEVFDGMVQMMQETPIT